MQFVMWLVTALFCAMVTIIFSSITMLLSAMLLRTGIEGPIAMNNLHGSQNFFGAISLGFWSISQSECEGALVDSVVRFTALATIRPGLG